MPSLFFIQGSCLQAETDENDSQKGFRHYLPERNSTFCPHAPLATRAELTSLNRFR